jgi:hypothetical protein
MSLDLLIILAGTLGALANRWAGPGPTMTRTTAIESLVAGLIMVIVNALGLVPSELQTAMMTNPVRTGAFVFVVAFLAGPGLISVGKGILFKAAPTLKNGNGPRDQTGSADLGLLLAWLVIWLVVMALLTGCASLGYQRSSVSFPRDDLLLLYADIRHDYGGAVALVEPACLAKTLPEVTCAKLAQLRERFAAGDRLFRAAVVAKRDVSLDDLRGLIGLATELGRLAGYPVPGLGGLGARP